jgi:glucose-1-phosphate thymidylyltransferase
MKGIILAGGSNTRLYPTTQAVSKQLLPVYDKPMIYYPLSVLMLAGLRDILIISTPRDTPHIRGLLSDGEQLGLRISYRVQDAPRGIADAFRVGRDYIAGEHCALILGDNILYGHNIYELLNRAAIRAEGATVFGYEVHDPERFGIVEIGPDGRALCIEEKPKKPKSHWAVIGLYFYDSQVCDFADSLKPSDRGELEITDINNLYLAHGNLFVERLYRGFAWLDCGNAEALQEASLFVQVLQKRQRYRLACIEEIAYRMGYIDAVQLRKLGSQICKSEYGRYILELAEETTHEPRTPAGLAAHSEPSRRSPVSLDTATSAAPSRD